MQIKCPNCGNICEVEEELAIGQHLICPFCSETFAYSGIGQGNESFLKDIHTEKDHCNIETKCPQCGALYEVEQDYLGQEATCETCGRNFAVTNIKSSDFVSVADITTQKRGEDRTGGARNRNGFFKSENTDN